MKPYFISKTSKTRNHPLQFSSRQNKQRKHKLSQNYTHFSMHNYFSFSVRTTTGNLLTTSKQNPFRKLEVFIPHQPHSIISNSTTNVCSSFEIVVYCNNERNCASKRIKTKLKSSDLR